MVAIMKEVNPDLLPMDYISFFETIDPQEKLTVAKCIDYAKEKQT